MNSERDLNSIQWLNGLEDYFEYVKDYEAEKMVVFLLRLLASEALTIDEDKSDGLVYAMSRLKKHVNNPIFEVFHKYFYEGRNIAQIKDAFARGQVKSKIWLVEELAKIGTNFPHIVVLAGWFGQLSFYLDQKIAYQRMRMVEIDPEACYCSDYTFNVRHIKDYKVKSIKGDINNLTLTDTGYDWPAENFKTPTETFNERFYADLIINTSAEHMSEEWFYQIKNTQLQFNPIVAVQSNNMFDVPEHVNCVKDLEEMKAKFPMREILYEGELKMPFYSRFMLIGRP